MEISKLSRDEILEIVNGSKINLIAKSVLLSTLRRSTEPQFAAIMEKLQTVIAAVQSGQPDDLTKIANELKPHAEKFGISANYIDEMLGALKNANHTIE